MERGSPGAAAGRPVHARLKAQSACQNCNRKDLRRKNHAIARRLRPAAGGCNVALRRRRCGWSRCRPGCQEERSGLGCQSPNGQASFTAGLVLRSRWRTAEPRRFGMEAGRRRTASSLADRSGVRFVLHTHSLQAGHPAAARLVRRASSGRQPASFPHHPCGYCPRSKRLPQPSNLLRLLAPNHVAWPFPCPPFGGGYTAFLICY